MPSLWLAARRLFIGLIAGIFSPALMADYTLNLTKGITPVSQEIHHLHMIILWVCVAIGILVYSLMIYAIIRHRRSKHNTPADFHESTTVEIIWTVIPFIILIVMAIPATKTLILMDDTAETDLTIKITVYRWYWHYDYLDHDINFFSYLSTPEDQMMNRAPKGEYYLLEVDKPLVVPVGKKIRLLTTSKDVIHSWWVPDLGVKKDAVPGFINESWAFIDPDKPGIYRGQCAELCGVKHGYMPIVLEAKSQEDFDAWVVAQKPKPEPVPQATDEVTQPDEAKTVTEQQKTH
jgi:cytochrome c oxidase subunit 2